MNGAGHGPLWQAGQVVDGRYEVIGLAGRGGMGWVYQVKHLEWGINLAVKQPRPDVVFDSVARAQFVREAEAWVSLGLHPNVCCCHYVRQLEGLPMVFAEYVPGGSLSEWIADGRLYEGREMDVLRRVLDVAIQFAWGLEHAHRSLLVVWLFKQGLEPVQFRPISDERIAFVRAHPGFRTAVLAMPGSLGHEGRPPGASPDTGTTSAIGNIASDSTKSESAPTVRMSAIRTDTQCHTRRHRANRAGQRRTTCWPRCRTRCICRRLRTRYPTRRSQLDEAAVGDSRPNSKRPARRSTGSSNRPRSVDIRQHSDHRRRSRRSAAIRTG
ncbi:protein kinase [Nocardia fluminea]|uniref:protein kinase domain-containing protein n=1 Tax=Nocardia fluminea TaxID=134984 RepID=UPI00371E9280